MAQPERQQQILDLLKKLKGLDPLKQLFWSELNYERVNQSLSRRSWSDTASKALADDPVLFASGGQDNEFHVIYARLTSDCLRLGLERPVVSKLLQDHPYALFVFSDKSQNRWHFLNVKYHTETQRRRIFRRITIVPHEHYRTAAERIAMLDIDSIAPDLYGVSPLEIQARHDEAFDVEKIGKASFLDTGTISGPSSMKSVIPTRGKRTSMEKMVRKTFTGLPSSFSVGFFFFTLFRKKDG